MTGGHPRNQKFITHFERLRQEAVSCQNLHLAKGLSHVAQSIRRYPLAITSISQAESLQGVGSSHITEFQRLIHESSQNRDSGDWKDHLKSRVEQFAFQAGGFPLLDSDDDDEVGSKQGRKRQKISSHYSPVIGSSPWACMILMHLYHGEDPDGVLVSRLHSEMERFATKYPKTTKFSDTLITKLVKQGILQNNTASGTDASGILTCRNGTLVASGTRVQLTEAGVKSCDNLWQRSLRSENLSSLLGLNEFIPEQAMVDELSYELVMLVDSREFSVMNTIESLNPSITVEQRPLPVSDVMWVWRKEKGDECLAGYVVERKAVDDLSTSIKDGRYEEQRRRLSRAPGVKNIIYLIEGEYSEIAKRNPTLIPEQSIRTAIRHTELTDGFSVIETKNIKETAQTLLEIHVRIQSMGLPRPHDTHDEPVVTFRDFASETHKSKTLTIAQMTSRMLRSIPGVGGESVIALHDYLVKIGKGGLSLGNLVSVISDPVLNENIKRITGAKRVPFSANVLAVLREQYQEQ